MLLESGNLGLILFLRKIRAIYKKMDYENDAMQLIGELGLLDHTFSRGHASIQVNLLSSCSFFSTFTFSLVFIVLIILYWHSLQNHQFSVTAVIISFFFRSIESTLGCMGNKRLLLLISYKILSIQIVFNTFYIRTKSAVLG